MFDFTGKVVLITGAAQGFGRVCAVAFAQRGARLALCDINDTGGAQTLAMVEAAGAKGLYRHADVSDESAVEGFVAATVEQFGRLDVAVNNAAKERPGPTLDLPSAAFDELIDTNLRGVYFCMKHEVAQMRKNGGGAIVNQASVTSSMTGSRVMVSGESAGASGGDRGGRALPRVGRGAFRRRRGAGRRWRFHSALSRRRTAGYSSPPIVPNSTGP